MSPRPKAWTESTANIRQYLLQGVTAKLYNQDDSYYAYTGRDLLK
jgi:hypothetical protein